MLSILRRALCGDFDEDPDIESRPLHTDSPVLTLPNEITSEIFMHFLPVYPLCPPFLGLLSPIILTQVCHAHQWREIALATPALWRAVTLGWPNRQTGYNQPNKLLELWIMRSHTCLLWIHIIDLPYKFAKILIAHRTRWEFLQVNWDVVRDFPVLLANPMSSLRHLELTHNDLLTCRLKRFTAWVVLPWSQLTSLTLTWVFPSASTPVLQQAVGLIYCDVTIISVPEDGREACITLPRLETLVLLGEEWQHAVLDYMETLVVPELRTLHVLAEFLGADPIHTLTSFIERSGCTLQGLHIIGQGRGSTTMNAYREAFPSIPTLKIHGETEDGLDMKSTPAQL
ncbi:hypothetical protein C8R43DRAFT_1134790 [Mycena crocata]|nr:hypothetical protein C8R43DRAFT_1134790 [Mycena crocata]